MASEEYTEDITRNRESSRVVVVGVLLTYYITLTKNVFLEGIIEQITRSRPSSRVS
jgi:hypothetical protein